jgi:phosphatidylethanolamine-binding protein (PEBP) family uncharacterized protein
MTVHALDVEQSGVDSLTSPASLESRLSDHVLAKATLTGVYERR